MRWQFKVMIVVFVGFFGIELVRGQQIQIPGIGGLTGLLGKDGRSDPLALLRNPEVKKELRLNEQQGFKIDAAIWKALAEALDAEQLKRLKQIDLQQKGYKAFADPIVQEELKLTESQKKEIQQAIDDAEKEMNTLMKLVTEGNTGGIQTVIDQVVSIGKGTKENCIEVLTAEQKRSWQEMIGDTFVFGGGVKIDIGDIGKAGKGAKKGATAGKKGAGAAGGKKGGKKGATGGF